MADFANERQLLRRCVQQIASQPLGKTLAAYSVNLGYYLQPSSQFYEQPHALVDRLPWRGVYDWVFSSYRLLILLLAALVVWARGSSRAQLLRGVGLALPVLLVVAASVTFERGENMRFKYFVEPVLYVFIVSQLGGARAEDSQGPRRAGRPRSCRLRSLTAALGRCLGEIHI